LTTELETFHQRTRQPSYNEGAAIAGAFADLGAARYATGQVLVLDRCLALT
jgi:hypothetical protein